ncbi:MAG: hypothetical protein A2Y78_02025 [Acidobacteria bacterium RBG_13_68_16]|nr:MAG: hypothetical protein A2Y78_02025 [Acidobacteria bacterium RBG_13_68_16]
MGERTWYPAGRAVGLLLRAWRLTVRVEARNREVLTSPYVLALWHGRMIGSLMDNFDTGCVAMVSRSNDGALAAGIAEQLGIVAARGSSSRGGREALSEMEDMMRGGAVPFGALTVDGPRGPWREVKPGVIALARRLRAPLIPITFSCRRAWVLRSWDRMVLPRPFAKVVVAYGEPWPPERLAGESTDVLRGVAQAINALTASLDREVAGRELWPPA